ncbi:thermonuclease family protein [Herminiimonas sp. CN]|uniref:thermonuclease family protein n=1 Tax=Herminiimonas sp. CN TaxID=1349818 RepID=UPI00047435E7|nr:thermonuclease family protein [Herminiimonas sp. CN]
MLQTPAKTIFALLLLCALPAHAHQVISIADGDTMTLLVDRQPLKIRLSDIDAPEKKQAFGQRSKESLSDLCWGKDATYRAQTVDRYGRTVARVTCSGIDANRAQVERGMAWVYAQYNKDSALPAVQQTARSGRKGLWADKVSLPPWEFRHPVKQASYQSQPQPVANESTCHTGPRGGRFQIINGRKRYGC